MTGKRRGRRPGPRIRTTKPEVWQEEAIGALSRDARLCREVLKTMADDEGRLRALPALVIGHGYPYDEDVTPAKLRRWLDENEQAGHVVRYEHEGTPYVAFRWWRKEQRIEKGKASTLPAPPDEEVAARNAVDAPDPDEFPELSGTNSGSIPEASGTDPVPPRGGGRAALPAGAAPGPGFEETATTTETRTAARATGTVVQHQLPDDFPPRLADRAEHVLAMLGALHPRLCRTGAEPPTLYRVGLAIRAYPGVDHVRLVHDLELWAMEPRRLRKGDLDLATTYRAFCERAARPDGGGSGGGPSPAGGTPPSVADVMQARERVRAGGAPA